MRARHRHFNPKTTGATLALDARFLSASNDDAIETWTSRTGSNDATQATAAAKPTYKTNIQGGQPALRFDGNDSLGFSANIISGTPSSGFAVFVYKVDADPPGVIGRGPVLGQFGSSLQDNVWPWSDGKIYDDFGTNLRKVAGDPTPSLANMNIISQHSATNDFAIFINGSNFYSTTSNFVAWSSTQRIGASGGYFLLGHIASAAFIPLKPTDAMRKRLNHHAAYSFKISCN